MSTSLPLKPRRLLYVVTGMGWGGAERQVIDLALAFKQNGWNVEVVSLLSHLERDMGELEEAGVPIRTLGMWRGRVSPSALLALRRAVKRFKPDVVHAHMVHANLLCRVTRLVAPMPRLITSAHNVNEGAVWRTWAYRLTDSLTDLTTNVSQVAVERSIETGAAPRNRIRFMPNGIDFEVFRPDASVRKAAREELGVGDAFLWLAVGSLEVQKDYPNLLRAVSALSQGDQEIAVIVAGKGPLADDLEREIKARGLASRVRLLGVRSDVAVLMQAADGYVLSSAWEGLPLVLIEAAASGLPIVATEVGGNGQIVQDGSTGRLVPSGDSGALADAMADVMALSPDERLALGEAARQSARSTYGLDEIVQAWGNLYLSPQEILPLE